MKAIQLISQDLFDKVRSRFQNLEMGDETGAVTIDPAEARFFDFDFINEGVNLGRVSISLNDSGSLKVYYSQGITENQDDLARKMWYSFLKEMRLFSMRRLLRFDTRDIAKTHLDKNDFQHLAATQGPKEEPDMNTMNETKRGLQEGRDVIATGTPDAIKVKIKELGLGPARRESTGSGGEAIFVFRNPNYYVSQGQDGNWELVQTNAESDQQGAAGGSGDSQIPIGMKTQYGTVVKVNGNTVIIKASNGELTTMNIHDIQQGVAEGEHTMNESRWNHKSSSKTSRAVRGKTEVVVRHVKKVAETYPGARSQNKNIKAIFIQNADGERAKYPFIHLAGAFAMAQHVDHGGVPHDPAGKAIIKMSEHIAQLGEFQRHIQRSSINSDAHGIAERAIGHMNELKARVAALGKRHHYQAWREDFDNSGMEPETDEMVLDAVTLEDYKNKFTQTNFQEELVGFFPLLHSIMREASTVDLEEYVEESARPWETDDEAEAREKDDDQSTDTKGSDGAEHGNHSRARHLAKQAMPKEGFEKFEEWAESTENGTLTPDQLNNLKAAIEALPQGDQGPELDSTAADAFFSNPDLGLVELPNFDEFKKSLHDEQGRDEEIRATPIQLFQSWAKENNPSLLAALGMEGGEAPQAAPEVPPAAPAAPAAPEQPVAEGSKGSMVQEVAKIVKSFYNASNESVGPFRGEEGIVIDVEKQISEKFGENAGKQAGEMARAFMEKLTQQWHQKHGKVANGPQDDGLARMMELVGNIKQKVEGMGQPEMEENNPQHSHQYDTVMKHADNPTYQQRMAAHAIKPGIAGVRDRIDMLTDLERTNKLKNAQEDSVDPVNVPAYIRKQKQPGQDLAKKSIDQKNKDSGAKVWSSPRLPKESFELESIMKLAGLAK